MKHLQLTHQGAIFTGLFDSLFGGMDGGGKLSPQEAYAGVLMGATACDGHFADDEVNSLVVALARMKLFERMNDKQFGQMLDKLHGVIKKKGVEFLIDGCVEQLPSGLEKTAFTNACDIVLADGVVEDDEKAFIDSLRKRLNIESKTAKVIAEIMVVKNKG